MVAAIIILGSIYLLSRVTWEFYPPNDYDEIPRKKYPPLPKEVFNTTGFVSFDEVSQKWKTE